MRNLPLDPEVVMLAVGIGLVCVFIGNLVRLLLTYEQYTAAGAVLGITIGVLLYFDRIRRRAA